MDDPVKPGIKDDSNLENQLSKKLNLDFLALSIPHTTGHGRAKSVNRDPMQNEGDATSPSTVNSSFLLNSTHSRSQSVESISSKAYSTSSFKPEYRSNSNMQYQQQKGFS